MKNDVTINADFTQNTGIIKRVKGSNLAPPIFNFHAALNLNDELKALKIPLTRLHDCPLENCGMKIVDIPMIFADFNADHTDPENYYFAQTDDYLENCLKTDTEILYRLGPSIEHTSKPYFIHPPTDFEKWAEICANIIRHYNQGWANGFHFNIRYWEIWNEANILNMWRADWDEYVKLYIVTAKKLKSLFPELKIGGPALAALPEKELNSFVKTCRDNNTPMDFFSWHSYPETPADVISEPAKVRKLLDSYGYNQTELHLNEWHYFPASWEKFRSDKIYMKEIFEDSNGVNGAAFLTAVLQGWQDTPLDMGNYYTGTSTKWGLFDRYGIRNKTYYAMQAFAKLAELENRFECKCSSQTAEVRAEAAKTADGRRAGILISNFKSEVDSITVNLTGMSNLRVRIYALDSRHNLEVILKFNGCNDKIVINNPENSCVYYIDLETL